MNFLLDLLLTFLTLLMLGGASRARGRTLWFVLLVFGWTVGQFNILVEAVVFRVLPLADALVQLGAGLVVFATFAALAVTCLLRWRGPTRPLGPMPVTTTDALIIVVAYEILYFGAGTLVWPHVASYYLEKGLPAQWLVGALQLPRALLFAAPAWLWLRSAPRFAPAVLGIAFAMLGAIAPMLPDNPYMPPPIRFAHAIETGSSNFVFGVLVGCLARRRARISSRAA